MSSACLSPNFDKHNFSVDIWSDKNTIQENVSNYKFII